MIYLDVCISATPVCVSRDIAPVASEFPQCCGAPPTVSAVLSCVALQCIPAARSMFSSYRSPSRQEHPVGRAPDARWAPVEDVRIHHRRGHVPMAQEFLHGANIVTVIEQVRGEGVAERVAGGPLGDAGGHHRVLHLTLQDRFMQVMAPPLPGHQVHGGARGWEDPLPSPLTARVGILAREGPRQLNPAGAHGGRGPLLT